METKKKYRLTNECIIHEGRTLYRIETLVDFSNIKAGTKGGFVESERNLSHDGACWVADDAMVYGGAFVYENAIVSNEASVFGSANVCGCASVYGSANVCGDAIVCGYAIVRDNAKVYEHATIFYEAFVSGRSKVYGHAKVGDFACVFDDAEICGKTRVYGHAQICNNAIVHNNKEYIVFKNWWSSGRYFTWTRSNNLWKVGCFSGNGEDLIARAYEDSEFSGREYERVVNYVKSILEET